MRAGGSERGRPFSFYVYNGSANDDDMISGVAIDATGNAYAVGATATSTSPKVMAGWLRKYSP
jgi:hypothetical protein